MKANKLIYLILVLFSGLVVSSCDPELTTYDENNVKTQDLPDSYIQVVTPVVSFQAGVSSYDMEFNIINGTKAVNRVDAYITYTDSRTGGVSAEKLYKSYTPSGSKTVVAESFTYNDLKDGLTVNGASLPTSDTELAIGSGWKLRFEGILADGSGVVEYPQGIRIDVLSPYAGRYKIIAGEYYRIGVLTYSYADGTYAGERFIGSVDETTYSYNDYWGAFSWPGSSFNFVINDDNTIDVPVLSKSGLFSGNRGLSCATEPSIFANVPCEGSNILVKDPNNPNSSNGRHKIYLTYGYFSDGSGAREFHEVLEKIVD
jgi:hypothetical protein